MTDPDRNESVDKEESRRRNLFFWSGLGLFIALNILIVVCYDEIAGVLKGGKSSAMQSTLESAQDSS